MTQLQLNENETALLIEILSSSLEDIKTERVRTDKRDMHAEFIKRETFLTNLINQLQTNR